MATVSFPHFCPSKLVLPNSRGLDYFAWHPGSHTMAPGERGRLDGVFVEYVEHGTGQHKKWNIYNTQVNQLDASSVCI